MDTKSKSSKKALGWIVRFLTYSLILDAIIIGILAIPTVFRSSDRALDYLQDVADPTRPDGLTAGVQARASQMFSTAIHSVIYGQSPDEITSMLKNEGGSILYYVEDPVSGRLYTNMPDWDFRPPDGYYPLAFFLEDGTVSEYKNGRRIQSWKPDFAYDPAGEAYAPMRAYMWVSYEIDTNLPNSQLAWAARSVLAYRIAAYVSVLAVIVLLIMTAALRKRRKEADRAIAGVTRRIWLEFKLLGLIPLGMIGYFATSVLFSSEPEVLLAAPLFLLGLLIYWADLYVNKAEVFRHNSVRCISRAWRRYTGKKPFQKRMWMDFMCFLAGEIVLLFFSAVFMLAGFAGNEPAFVIPALFILIPAVAVLWLYCRRFKRLAGDLGRLDGFVSELEAGRFEKQLSAEPDAVLYPVLSGVNNIQSGFVTALQKATKAERMRVDLVTNVSHDLKTPLTSIISYVELLSRMELPGEAREHVEVLAAKSERLKLLIQDLFDLAKSTSGDIELQMETLDLARLVMQTMFDRGNCETGETDGVTGAFDPDDYDANLEKPDGGVRYKMRLSDRPLWINGDGSKLIRVLHNLLDNADKYSMPGTRVYVSARREDNQAVFDIKNVANYEMGFDPDEVTERFVRGDRSRSDDGSGLGLAIARSFTESCGGSLSVEVDGDLFKVRLTFPLREKPEPSSLEELITDEREDQPEEDPVPDTRATPETNG